MVAETHATDMLIATLTTGASAHALFLDVDGTLLDIADTPMGVYVPDALPALVAGLATRLDGALALLSGRPIAELDQLFTPVRTAAAGAHGAQFRSSGEAAPEILAAGHALPEALRDSLMALASADPGLLSEDKGSSIALHYRGAPRLQDELRRRIEDLLDAQFSAADQRPELMAGKMIYEIKHTGYNKGTALARYMAGAPFAGRKPVVIGDDTTDEFAFERAVQLGGLAFSVGRPMPGAAAVFESPEQVRRALQRVLTMALTEMLRS